MYHSPVKNIFSSKWETKNYYIKGMHKSNCLKETQVYDKM